MSESKKKEEDQRTIQDKVISGLNSARYSLAEPAMLRLLRLRHAKEYEKGEKNPLVSVYVPTYNRAELLMKRAVASVLDQTYKNFELIIIGDCCTDKTEELVSQIKDKRVRFYNLPKKTGGYPLNAKGRWCAGPVKPANKALGLVRGKWIARIDDDDIFTPDHIEALLRFAQEHQYEFVSAAYIEERDGKRYVIDEKDTKPRIGGTQTWLYRSYLKHFRYNINCWRKSWNRVNDYDLQARMYGAGVNIGFLDKVVACILPRPGEKTIGWQAYQNAEETGFKKYYGEK